MVIDGLDSQFIQSPALAGAAVMRSFGNRKHIYFLNLTFSYDNLLLRRARREQEEEKRQSKFTASISVLYCIQYLCLLLRILSHTYIHTYSTYVQYVRTYSMYSAYVCMYSTYVRSYVYTLFAIYLHGHLCQSLFTFYNVCIHVEEIEEAEQVQIELERAKEEALLALSEDEFEALDSEMKEEIERKRYNLKKERLQK